MRNSFFALFLVLTLACKQESSDSKAPKIGFVLATLQEERYTKDKKYFEDKVKSLGGQTLFASADNDDKNQLAKVENLLAQGIKVLVIQPVNSESASSFVEMAHREGVKVIAYDRAISFAAEDLYVTQDSYQVGVLQAEAAARFTQEKGNFVILRGEAGHSVAAEISRGVLDTLKKYPKIRVVVDQSHAAWSADAAMKTVENALTVHKNSIDAILANNSGMANGAVQALVEQKLAGKVFVAGADADLAAVKNIVAGSQQFEVLKAIQPLAETAAEAAMNFAQGKAVSSTSTLDVGKGIQVPVLSTPVYGVDKDNLQKVVIDSGFHTQQEVFGR